MPSFVFATWLDVCKIAILPSQRTMTHAHTRVHVVLYSII
jgi:hypothetical protein